MTPDFLVYLISTHYYKGRHQLQYSRPILHGADSSQV